jgi:Cu-processing system permease protein
MIQFSRVRAIAQNTFRETVRDRILWSALVVSLLLFFVALFAGTISLGQDKRIVVDIGLSAIYALQVFVAIFVGSMMIVKEVDRKTFFLILPKPILREEILLGKFFGLMGTMITVTFLTTLAFGAILVLQGLMSLIPLVLLALLLSLCEGAILILLSLAFSVLTSPTLAALYTLGCFLIGHSGGILRELITRTDAMLVQWVLEVAYFVMPNLEKFNIRNQVVYAEFPEATAVILSILYAVALSVLLFLLARWMFNQKEF